MNLGRLHRLAEHRAARLPGGREQHPRASGPALTLPIFDGGPAARQSRGEERRLRRRGRAIQPGARRCAARRRRPADVAAQRSTSSAGQQALALATAQEAYDLALLRYREGVGNYLRGAGGRVAVARAAEPRRRSARARAGALDQPGPRAGRRLRGRCARARSCNHALELISRSSQGSIDHGQPTTNGRLATGRRAPQPERAKRRKRWLAACIGVFAVAGIAYGAYWACSLRYHESTDNAYVGGNVVQITPQIAGTVVAIGADDTDFVKAGQALVAARPGRRAGGARAGRGAARARPCARCAACSPRRAPAARPTSQRARSRPRARERRPGAARTARQLRRGIGKEEVAARARRGSQRAGGAGRGARAARRQPRARGPHHGREPSRRAKRRGAGARGLPRLRAHRAAGAGVRLRRQAQRAGRPARAPGHAADGGRAARPGLGRRQLQGSAAAQACASASR